VYVSEHLSLQSFGKGYREMSCSPTGPWEIRPTGMTREACGTVSGMGAGLRSVRKLAEHTTGPYPAHAPHFYPNPSNPGCRTRVQSTGCCFGPMIEVVSETGKGRA
jgi:hypothetical protein